jgi:hypothetical protein
VLFPDTEATPLFAGAGILLALWAVGTGLVGTGRCGGGTPAAAAVPAATRARVRVLTRGEPPTRAQRRN